MSRAPSPPAGTRLGQRQSTVGPALAPAADPLLDAVTRPPELPRPLISRLDLVRRLVSSPAALALVIAPPGYGKTTLLREWSEHDPRPFVWVALAECELDIPRQDACASWDRLPELVRSLARRHESFVLVVDDAHWIDRQALGRVVQAALNELPAGSVIAIASRTPSPLPTARLRAHRALDEVRAAQLAMSTDDAAALLAAERVEPDPELIQELTRRTEGWPAALYLSALSLRDDAEPSRGDGQRHLPFDFVADEVLAALPAELMTFALRTSILDELSPRACDAVLEGHGSGRRLRELARRSTSFEPVDPAAGTYRWHPLVRDTLRTMLTCEADDERELQRRACLWYQSTDDQPRAIDHALAAGDLAVAGALIGPHVVEYALGGRRNLLRSWLEAFPSAVIQASASLSLAAALGALFDGDTGAAENWATAASVACAREGDACVRERVEAGIAVVRGMSARRAPRRLDDVGSPVLQRQLQQSEFWPLWLFIEGASAHRSGDHDAADELLDEASRLSATTAPCLAALAIAQRAMIAMERKDWDTAAELSDRAVLVAQEWSLTRDPLSALVYAAAAASRAHDGRVDEAKADLRRGTDLVARLSDFVPWYGAEVRMLLAHASLWLADIVGARTLLAEASRFARRMPDTVAFSQWFEDAWAYMDDLAESRLSGPSSLTIAELRVLRFLPSHRSFREIATQLGVSANTVKTQAHAVYRKLGAASRSEAVAQALDAGLLGQ